MPRTKDAALAALHASRRGVPVHPEPPPELAELAALAAEGARLGTQRTNPATLRKMGAAIGVNDKTVAKWFRGEDRPARGHHAAIRRVTKAARAAIAALRKQAK